MIQLENGHFSLTLDENGHLAEMSNLDSKRVLTLPHALLRLIIGDAQCLELEAVPSGIPEIQKTDDTVTLRYPAIDCDQRGRLEVGVEMRIHLAEDEIQWEISLDNRTADATVREVHYPVLALRDPNSPMAAVTSNKVSERIYDLPKQIQSCFTEYMAPDQKYIRYSTLYPDRFNAMNCFLLDWGADGFYVGCHDETFELTGHVFELEKNTSLNMTMVRYPFLKPGAGWQENKIRTAPYCGGWMTGAKKYRAWADTWFRPPVIPEEIACSSGWQRIILHHQYGEYFFPYDKLEQAYDEAAKAGIHTLFLFGWTAEGMDSGYPVYTPDPSQGGFEKLKETIRKIQAKGG